MIGQQPPVMPTLPNGPQSGLARLYTRYPAQQAYQNANPHAMFMRDAQQPYAQQPFMGGGYGERYGLDRRY